MGDAAVDRELLVGWTVPAAADLQHRTTLPDLRIVSLAYDPRLCGIWVADEGPILALLSPVGRELLRVESGMRSVRSLTVERDGLLLASGWGDFRRIDRQGRAIEEPFQLSETLRDTEGLHGDADGGFLVVEDDPSRLLRISPDGSVLMALSGDGFDPPMIEPQGGRARSLFRHILVVEDNEGTNSPFELRRTGAC